MWVYIAHTNPKKLSFYSLAICNTFVNIVEYFFTLPFYQFVYIYNWIIKWVCVCVSESYQRAIYQLAIKSSVKRTHPRGEKLVKWIYDSENVSWGGGVFSYTLGRYGPWQMNPSCPLFRVRSRKTSFQLKSNIFFLRISRDANFGLIRGKPTSEINFNVTVLFGLHWVTMTFFRDGRQRIHCSIIDNYIIMAEE